MASHGGDDNALPRANEGESIIKVVQNDDDLGLMDVESMCMNCHNNVSCQILYQFAPTNPFSNQWNGIIGINQISPDQDPILPRCSPRVV